tara:strand:- start:17 stop:1045 length:1029 start_codon:yes stop_codon:yes gene_type:complete
MNPEVIVEAYENGERELEPYLEKMGWTSWLGVAELGLALQSDITEFVNDKLTIAEKSVLELVKARLNGKIDLKMINSALKIATDPDTRDLALEGRLRMERGLVLFEQGKNDEAKEDLTWAETRLKSVAKASRDHDISLLNKAAFHLSIDEPMMALQVHSDISRNGGHAHETIAISRIQVAKIMLGFGHMFDAARNAFNSHAHAIFAGQIELAVEAGAVFVEVASAFMDDEAENFADQISEHKPRTVGEEAPVLRVNPTDVNGVLDWCIENTQQGYNGEERPDLRALVMLAKRIDRTDAFTELLSNPSKVEDALLAALCASISTGVDAVAWTDRVTEIMTLKD